MLNCAEHASRGEVLDENVGVPNLYWQAVPWNALRACRRFVSLPVPDQVVLHGSSTHVYFRQDTQLWQILHLDVLTTRHINAALGFYEQQAGKRLSMPKNKVSHSALLSVQDFLVSLEVAKHDGSGHGSICTDALDACQTGTSLARRYNEALIVNHGVVSEHFPVASIPDADLGGKKHIAGVHAFVNAVRSAPGCENSGRVGNRRRKKSGTKKIQKNGSAQTEQWGSARHKWLRAEAAAAALQSQKGLHLAGPSLCRWAALQGQEAVRMAWGEIHEPSALLSLLTHLPDSYLCEAGLCHVSSLPPECGISIAELPSLGASPDCMIVHCVRVPPSLAGRLQDPGLDTKSLPPDLLREVLNTVAVNANFCSRLAHRERNTPAEEAPAAGVLGDCSMGDLPDGSPCSSFLPYDSPVSISLQDEDGHCWVRLAEVVEVKSSCPFYSLDSRSKASWGRHSSAGLRQNVPPMYIAQLQLEMLATGTQSGLLVQYSAQDGAAVHRVFRDDQYLFGMLGTLRRFYAEHGCTSPGGSSPARPKPNLYYERHEYQQLLHRATHLSRVASASEPWILPPFSHPEKLERAAEICGLTGDAAPFWDTTDFMEPFVSP